MKTEPQIHEIVRRFVETGESIVDINSTDEFHQVGNILTNVARGNINYEIISEIKAHPEFTSTRLKLAKLRGEIISYGDHQPTDPTILSEIKFINPNYVQKEDDIPVQKSENG